MSSSPSSSANQAAPSSSTSPPSIDAFANLSIQDRPATGGPQPHRVAPAPPPAARLGGGGGGPPPRPGGSGGGPSGGPMGGAGGGGGGGGPMSAQERARQMAGARMPPSLQAKLAANAARSSSASPASQPSAGPSSSSSSQGSSPGFMSSQQRLDASSLLSKSGGGGGPGSGGPSFPPSSAPGMGGLAARRAGGFPGGQAPNLSSMGLGGRAGGGGGPPAAGLSGKRQKPGLKLSDIGGGAAGANGSPSGGAGGANRSMGTTPSLNSNRGAQPPGRLASAPSGGLMSSAFSEFSDVIDPSGRLNFAGKAILHASGVEFGNGTSFKINMEDLELHDVLGKGNYGEVRKVRHTKTGVEMAMKEIRLELDASKLNAIIMELDILHRAVSPEIVEFYGAFFIESCVFYCMEYMDAGSLESLLDGPTSVPEPVLARITSRMVSGLAFLKDSLQIMHRDVKPTNVLVNSRGEVKLCDFGVSGQLEKSLAKTNIGCQSYMAPERIKGESLAMPSTYTVASDVWSLGLSIVEAGLGVYPYPPETYSNVFAQLQAIVHGDPPQLPAEAYSDVARAFVAGCLEKVPERRFTYAQMARHPWLVEDAKRGLEGVDMVAWVQRAMSRRKERKEAASKGGSVTPTTAATGANGAM